MVILPEIKELGRVYFATDGLLEVCISDFAISVSVKPTEKLLELLFIELNAPVTEIDLEFLRRYVACFVLIQVLESLFQRLPLELNLVQHCFLNVQPQQLALPRLDLVVLLYQVVLIRRVLY